MFKELFTEKKKFEYSDKDLFNKNKFKKGDIVDFEGFNEECVITGYEFSGDKKVWWSVKTVSKPHKEMHLIAPWMLIKV